MNEIQAKIPVLLERVRTRRPVVHAITNWVTGGDVANTLQALGARPVLALAPEEVAEITSRSDALLLNLGTPDFGENSGHAPGRAPSQRTGQTDRF